MRASVMLVGAGMAVCGMAGQASAGESPYNGPAPTAAYYYCTGLQQGGEQPDETVLPTIMYYSRVFGVVGQLMPATQKEYLEYLKKTYDFKENPAWGGMQVACNAFPSMDQAIARKRKLLDDAAKKPDGKSVQTDWTFSGASATEPVN